MSILGPVHGPIPALTKSIVNNSSRKLYIVDRERRYILDSNPNRPTGSVEHIAFVAGVVTDHITVPNFSHSDEFKKMMYPIYDFNSIPLPQPGAPSIIPGLNALCFYSKEEMDSKLEEFGSCELLVDAYMRSISNMINGAYRIITRLTDKPLYFTTEEGHYEIPKCNQNFADGYLKKNAIDKDTLMENDVIIIITVADHRDAQPTVISTRHQTIKRDLQFPNKPILSVENGLILFSSKDNAKHFNEKYKGKYLEYFVEEAMYTAEGHFKKEIEKIKENSKKRSSKTIEIIALMGLSAVVGALSQYGVEVLVEKLKDSKSKAFMFF